MTHGMWTVTYAHPEHVHLKWHYMTPLQEARTERAARESARARHEQNAARTAPRFGSGDASGLEVQEVTLRAAVLSRERALAWITLQQNGAITEDGWAPAGGRDAGWRTEVTELHQRLREHVLGFGASVAEVLRAPEAAAAAAWAIEGHTDRFGRVWWDKVRAEIHQAGLSWLWQTPYGMAWIDQS